MISTLFQNTEAQRTRSFLSRISSVISVPPCFKCSRSEIAEHGYVLTPSRHVGTEEVEDDGVLFVSKPKRDLTRELATQFHESEKMQSVIRDNMQKLGFAATITLAEQDTMLEHCRPQTTLVTQRPPNEYNLRQRKRFNRNLQRWSIGS